MSEGAQNAGDGHAVVGEPVSEPHQAAVMGEPPEGITPVLGEPVPLANGAQEDQHPVSSPSPDESATNGIHEDTPPASELPSQSTDAPSTAPSLEDPSPSAVSAVVEQSSSEEVSAEAGSNRSSIETPVSPQPTRESSNAPTQETEEAKTDAEISTDEEITHITDIPTELPPLQSEITSTENPYSALDEDSQESVKDMAKDELPVADRSLDVALPSIEVDEALAANVSPAKDEESIGGSGMATAESPAAVMALSVAHEEPEKGLAADTLDDAISSGAISGELSSTKEGSKEIKAAESNETEELSNAEQRQFDVSTQDSSAASLSPEATDLGSASRPVNIGDGSVQEDENAEGNSAKPVLTSSEANQVVSREDDEIGEDSAKSVIDLTEAEQGLSKEDVREVDSHVEVSSGKTEDQAVLNSSHVGTNVEAHGKASPEEEEQVVLREVTAQPEVFCNEKVSAEEGGNLATPDPSQEKSDNNMSSEASLSVSSGIRAIPVEEFSGDQQLSDGTALGENGFQHGQDGIPLEGGQVVSKDDSENAEVKDKSTSHVKMPFLFTTLIIAFAGVAVAAFSRSRQ